MAFSLQQEPTSEPAATPRAAALARYVPRDPYRPLEPGAVRVDFYAPSYVQKAIREADPRA